MLLYLKLLPHLKENIVIKYGVTFLHVTLVPESLAVLKKKVCGTERTDSEHKTVKSKVFLFSCRFKSFHVLQIFVLHYRLSKHRAHNTVVYLVVCSSTEWVHAKTNVIRGKTPENQDIVLKVPELENRFFKRKYSANVTSFRKKKLL
jgi:hypothetical protein